MKYSFSFFTVFVSLKSALSPRTSNLSLCSDPKLNSEDCLATNVEVALKNLENCNTNMGVNLLDSFITNSIKVEPSSGPLNVEEMITLKLRERSCAKASEYIQENNCEVFDKKNTSQILMDAEKRSNRNNTTPADRERENGLATTALYLYGWLAYRLVFVFLQQM